jgi:hypothetical protein
MPALISEDAPHEYACRALFVELALDEDKCFGSPCDASCLRLVGGKLPLDKPLKDRETPIRIFEVLLGRLVDLHDLWRLLSFCSYKGHVLVAREDSVWYQLVT